MKNALGPRKQSAMNDRWVFYWIYPLIALAVVHIGNENSFKKLISIPSYYSDLLLAFACTYGVGWYIRSLFSQLNRRFPREDQLKLRLGYQLLLGVIFPVVIIIGIELGYLSLLAISWQESSVPYLELPLVIVFCTLINLIYFILYDRSNRIPLQEHQEALKKQEYLQADTQRFVVKKGNSQVQLPATKIAYFYVQDKLTFLCTQEGEKYLYESSLKELKEQLSGADFFQLNRQLIASRGSIVQYYRTETRRLQVVLQPPIAHEVYVAKTKAAEFSDWLSR